ncbi:MAG: rod shape-determining protein RodA [Microgenomates group bacterium]
MLPPRRFDFFLFLPIVFLLGIGVFILASVAPANLSTHLLYVFISLCFFFFFSLLDLEIIFPFSPFVYVFSLFFLMLPLFLGTAVRGSARWISLGQFTIQPSEIVKPLTALIFAWYWARRKVSLRNIFFAFLIFIPIVILIFFQPDLGSSLAVASIFIGCLLATPLKMKHILVFLAIFLLTAPTLWFSLKDYQKYRVVHFLNPYSDPLGKGYNLIQAKISVGSGKLFGRGFGRGTQSHLAFLPERYTDFVFASLTEEIGFLGGSIILVLYFWLFSRMFRIASRSLTAYANDKFFFLLSIGIIFYLSFQVLVNIGMNLGLLPITGIPLPLVSYGGSSLVSTMISLGILESIANRFNREETLEIK